MRALPCELPGGSPHAVRVLAVALALVVAACGSGAPSASTAPPVPVSPAASVPPPATAAPSASPAASPTSLPIPSETAVPPATPEPTAAPASAVAWRYPVRGEADVAPLPVGSEDYWWRNVYVLSWRTLTLLDALGRDAPGWPVTIGTGDLFAGGLVVADNRDAVLLVRRPGVGYEVARYETGGGRAGGWPYRIDAESCSDPILASNGRIVLACDGRVFALQRNGRLGAGWPVSLGAAAGGGLVEVQAGDGGSILASVDAGGAVTAWMLEADGRVRADWPVRLPADGSPTSGSSSGRAMLLPDDRVLAMSWTIPDGQCALADRTTLRVLRPDGRTAGGWPVTIEGAVSREPAMGLDGSIYLADSAGRLRALAPDGSSQPGFPVTVPVEPACDRVPDPVLAKDGTVYLSSGPPFGSGLGAGSVVAVTPAGRVPTGWPYAALWRIAYPCQGCTPGPMSPHPPLVDDGLVIVGELEREHAAGRARVAVLRTDGSAAAGWPATVGNDVRELRLLLDRGRLYAILVNDGLVTVEPGREVESGEILALDTGG